MCQMSVVIERDGGEELVMEEVTNLEVSSDSLRITSLFEGPRSLDHVVIRSIDFMAGKVRLEQTG